MTRSALEIRLIVPDMESSLTEFFEVLTRTATNKFFHPHPFTKDQARLRARYSGMDIYCVLVENSTILAYGMLRGWDEGFAVPSLGIVVHPDEQGRGYGRLMMNFLRAAAIRRGSKKIRLRVYPDNLKAASLYQSLGYELAPEPNGPCLIGFLNLDKSIA